MTRQRYNELMDDEDLMLTLSEILEGWHFCCEWDCLLVGPGMEGEIEPCKCFPKDHQLYKNKKRTRMANNRAELRISADPKYAVPPFAKLGEQN